ncbi:MAG TPA: hypothetical protein VMO88_01080, partial [Acidimicrobiales bacterium]|nr:hypothetical protein [Acidimicrobiales bacterium]
LPSVGVAERGYGSVESQLVVAVVAVLCVFTLVLLVSWGLRVINDIDELQNPPRGRYGAGRPAP